MHYVVHNREGEYLDVHYMCYGLLASINELGSEYWRDEIDASTGYEADDYDDVEIPGFSAAEIAEVETTVSKKVGWQKRRDITKAMMVHHPMFSHMSFGEDTFTAEFRDGMQCDEILMPMFIVRNIMVNGYGVKTGDILELVMEATGNPFLAGLMQASMYTANALGKVQVNVLSNDSGILPNAKVGDLLQLLRGRMPLWFSGVWGTDPAGYPDYGWSGANGGIQLKSHTEMSNQMTDCFLFEKNYADPFENQFLCQLISRMDISDFMEFVKKVDKIGKAN